ncbi:hypothetical protein TGPRC2_293254 [Toxoplasma gondii TgCatPRC2]|uniref:Uncharacterized protein n=8 Tax=Toxoplasma gondii TaxID=5811 RepID=A0A125YLC8_TOXGV|nr:hypothetical protein TGGT1_293254 [Toxoplasma gondii GT1]ESS29219.1 hypothetical protein TGVEG_293254 [Toxoplasma gondii VEG]KFG35814.1 hypothetical protein TGP89_293254 [Toxoplasma gondii p89]KFH14416.1 hypothetical protein TGMAS_293254 [Toxoplasma gondii MAS]KYF38882.1 hypothetical protein TGARI_293254 [Toxoplasma gondii ARI]KYK65983.1 hypothetical protein TGPRC2_293254 [Toxoplasma gondii TgCatPRC2]PUA86935.1 hypothetical protein TGBR9_293254 [Toxoplasma gondii TgCATBr9]RQX68741.1 hypot
MARRSIRGFATGGPRRVRRKRAKANCVGVSCSGIHLELSLPPSWSQRSHLQRPLPSAAALFLRVCFGVYLHLFRGYSQSLLQRQTEISPSLTTGAHLFPLLSQKRFQPPSKRDYFPVIHLWRRKPNCFVEEYGGSPAPHRERFHGTLMVFSCLHLRETPRPDPYVWFPSY